MTGDPADPMAGNAIDAAIETVERRVTMTSVSWNFDTGRPVRVDVG